VDLAIEILRALLMAAVPIGAFTFALVWWALRGGYFEEVVNPDKLQDNMEATDEARKRRGKKKRVYRHPVQKKWASFGGGFYGIVAFFTWSVIEVQDIVATITGFGGLTDFLRQLNVGLIVDMFLEAIFNFVAAVTWPLYWMSSIDAQYSWVWFLAAYAGYWQGLKLARRAHRERQEEDQR
jgi:nitrogen fixation-related uncharacterized protein